MYGNECCKSYRASAVIHVSYQRILLLLLVILSGCASLFSNSQPTASPQSPGPRPTNATPALTTDSDIAHALVQKMSLDEKLGQMVIVEFYGSTLNADLTQMIAGTISVGC